jgi:hypothetical protein
VKTYPQYVPEFTVPGKVRPIIDTALAAHHIATTPCELVWDYLQTIMSYSESLHGSLSTAMRHM